MQRRGEQSLSDDGWGMGADQWARGMNGCNEAAVKIAFNFAGVAAGLRVSTNGRLWDTSGCMPLDGGPAGYDPECEIVYLEFRGWRAGYGDDGL